MAEIKRKFRLGEMLVAEGKISESQLEEALKRAKTMNTILGETLVEMGMIKPGALLKTIGQQIGLPAVELRPGMIDSVAVEKLSKDKAEYYGVIPMFLVEDRLTMAISKPLSIFDFDDLERITEISIQLVLCQPDQVREAIEKHYTREVNLDGLLHSIEKSKVDVINEKDQTEQIGEISEDSPIASLVNYILSTSISHKASDIHIEPDGKIVRVRYRIDGVLRELLTQKIGLHPAIVSRIKVMSKLDIAERRRPQDGRIQASINNRDVDIRVSTLPTTSGEKVVMRVLDSANLVFNLEQLGFRPPLVQKFTRCVKNPHGLFLVTGPTGSGKTTTLYSALNMLRTPEQNIITIEDPVEYQLGMVNQVQINNAIELNFATILRAVLRQDPNIIMLGEIRDSETAEVAVQASLTGHLVLSTLHTNSSIGAISRLTNLKVEPFLLASSVIGIIAQRLTRRICAACKQTYQPEPDLLARMGLQADAGPFWKGAGCKNCFNSGYRGRVGLYEILEVVPDMRRLLERAAPPEELKLQRQKSGETTLFDEGMIAVAAGQTTLDEVLRVAGGASSNE